MATLSRVAERATTRFPFLYFSMRCGMLGVTLGALVAWLVTGFNVVEGAVPLIGIQWSTFATFSFFFYLLMVNFQAGGIRGFGQLWENMKMDFRFLVTMKRREYPQASAMNPWRAVIVSTLVCVSALFAFETVWVFLYDYFQFGSLMWPVYFAYTSTPVIVRNIGLFLMPLFLAPLILTTPLDLTTNRFSVKFRLGMPALFLALLAAGIWINWVIFPSQPFNVASLNVTDVMGLKAGAFDPAACYIWPAQHYFPQNTYTFYPCSLKGVGYTVPQILGFFSPDNAVHAVNVLTKFATFAAVCFPFMVFARREK